MPRIEGLELRLAYREKAFSPERGLGGNAESGEGVAKDNFVFVYTDQKGRPEDLDPRLDGPLNGEQLLYGPYEGDDVMTLTISDLPAKVRGAEELDIEGAAVQKADLEVGSLYAVARSSGVTYTMETNSASGREEEEWLGILAKISKGEKN
ncbi:hypothetical protein [Saccharibacillus sp. O23]|uniref:hypothetical protein n=1 Tax=Saccharibacillus sp. O23 TaxID=2009338 RepID=UPI00117B4827|nr:hypothetical protein [Saccharibacillus sp. O23]